MQTSDTLDCLIAQGFSDDILIRFWRSVIKTHSCWLWILTPSKMGYGRIRTGRGNDERIYAHRLSWIVHNGHIPDGLHVLHHCDTPLCVRPDHLFLGTQTDNMADKVAKGRQAKGSEFASRAKLKETEVIQILTSGNSVMQKELATRFNVSPSTIGDILYRRTWKHISR